MPEEVFLARTKSFTRRSRELSPALERSFAAASPTYVLDVPRGQGLTSVAEDFALNPAEVFGRAADLVVEVGSGRGEQLLHAATTRPERNYLAFEVWVPGIARLVSGGAELGLNNLRVIEADAQQALKTILPEGSVSEVWTFFPDPWRKARHHKRRLVAKGFATTVERVLRDGGVWRMATDWEDYSEQMVEVLAHAPNLTNPYQAEGGFAPRFEGRLQTHFEERGEKDGRLSYDLMVVRNPRPKLSES